MTSWRQFQANRLNALKSTGPRTEEGKRISRRNALRHGLTAETVIDGLEDGEDYRGFEAAIIADYDAETAVERELVLRRAILDRLVHNAYRFALEGPSMRKPEADTDAATTTTEAKLAKGAKK